MKFFGRGGNTDDDANKDKHSSLSLVRQAIATHDKATALIQPLTADLLQMARVFDGASLRAPMSLGAPSDDTVTVRDAAAAVRGRVNALQTIAERIRHTNRVLTELAAHERTCPGAVPVAVIAEHLVNAQKYLDALNDAYDVMPNVAACAGADPVAAARIIIDVGGAD